MIEVFVEGVRVNMKNGKRVVMLREKDGSRYLPIWIGHFEADAIAIPMQNVPVSRPLTHDFALTTISQMGGKTLHAVISELRDETYYAKVVVEQDSRQIEVDARPSDAVSIALRAGVPILVDESLPFMEFPEVKVAGSEGDGTASNGRLVDHLKSDGHLRSPEVEAAFRAVPRHLFLPALAFERVYRDAAVATKVLYDRPVSSCSQPSLVAMMLEQLGLQPGERVLEVGSGTGYNAALMAHIVGQAGRVVTIEIDDEIADGARQHLEAAGLGSDPVAVVVADGAAGRPEEAPFERIIVTVGAWDIAPAWWEQLEPDGRLVLPLSIGGVEVLVAFEPRDGHLASLWVHRTGFVPLRGPGAAQRTRVPLGPDPVLYLETDTPEAVDGDAASALLAGRYQDHPTGLDVTQREVSDGLLLWLAAREPELAELVAQGSTAYPTNLPSLFTDPRYTGSRRSSYALLRDGALAALTRAPGQGGRPERDGEAPFDLLVRTYGADDGLSAHLIERTVAWDAAGRPGIDRVRIRAYPVDDVYQALAGEVVVRKRWTNLVLDWS